MPASVLLDRSVAFVLTDYSPRKIALIAAYAAQKSPIEL